MTLPMSFMPCAPVSLIDRGDRRLRLGLRHLLRQKALDDLDLAALLVGELLAAALVVELDQFLALLDHLLQKPEQVVVGERPLPPVRASMSAFLIAALTSRRVESLSFSCDFIALFMASLIFRAACRSPGSML